MGFCAENPRAAVYSGGSHEAAVELVFRQDFELATRCEGGRFAFFAEEENALPISRRGGGEIASDTFAPNNFP